MHADSTSCLAQVSRASWHMAGFGAETSKPQYAYSNSPAIRMLKNFESTSLNQKVKKNHLKVETCRKYKNKDGKDCYVGTSRLKGTEILECALCGKDTICFWCMIYIFYFFRIPNHISVQFSASLMFHPGSYIAATFVSQDLSGPLWPGHLGDRRWPQAAQVWVPWPPRPGAKGGGIL